MGGEGEEESAARNAKKVQPNQYSLAYTAVSGMTRMVEVFGNVENITVDYMPVQN